MKITSFYFLLPAFLALSWMLPWTRPLWDYLDSRLFFACNSLLELSPKFWAFANGALFDWLHDAVFASVFLVYILKGEYRQRFLHVVSAIAISALTLFLINKMLFPKVLHISRASPSIIYHTTDQLTKLIGPNNVKTKSLASFPADHGTTACLFVYFTYLFLGTRSAILAFLYAILIVLPRMVVGAHWATDILIGSLPIATFSKYVLVKLTKRGATLERC